MAERLTRTPGLDIMIAGRHAERARDEAARLRTGAKSRVSSAAIDAESVTPSKLTALAPSVVVNASGPFQTQDYTLAKACIAACCHYVDLADARGFVAGIGGLDRDARAAGVAVVSGASTVPGLSSAVVRRFMGGFRELRTIDIGISPGNSFDPGLATTRSVLGGAGRAFPVLVDRTWHTVHGWQGLHTHIFPEIGPRRMGYVEVPDLDLFPARNPTLETVRTWAGVEVGLFHRGIWALAGLSRAKLLPDPAILARPLLGLKRMLRFLGTDCGGMFVEVTGPGADGDQKRLEWHIIAKQGHGPYIPAIASVILARRLARREGVPIGAYACFELFTLEQFMAEVADLNIRWSTR